MVLSIDPGNEYTGYVVLDDYYKPVEFGKIDNKSMLDTIIRLANDKAIQSALIEMIGHYGTGMPAGRTVFDTCIWIGRFEQKLSDLEVPFDTVLRKVYTSALLGSPKAKDSNVIQYLIDRFAPYTPNRGKGSKKEPGFFYGFSKDVWQAYCIGVYAVDCKKGLLNNDR